LLAWAIALWIATLHALECDRRPLKWWKWIGLSVETGVGVTRGLSEYGRWAIAINVSHQIHEQNFETVN